MPVYFSQRNLTDRHSVHHFQHYTKFKKKVNALSNIKKQISTFEEAWKTGRMEEPPFLLSSPLPTFQSSNPSED